MAKVIILKGQENAGRNSFVKAVSKKHSTKSVSGFDAVRGIAQQIAGPGREPSARLTGMIRAAAEQEDGDFTARWLLGEIEKADNDGETEILFIQANDGVLITKLIEEAAEEPTVVEVVRPIDLDGEDGDEDGISDDGDAADGIPDGTDSGTDSGTDPEADYGDGDGGGDDGVLAFLNDGTYGGLEEKAEEFISGILA